MILYQFRPQAADFYTISIITNFFKKKRIKKHYLCLNLIARSVHLKRYNLTLYFYMTVFTIFFNLNGVLKKITFLKFIKQGKICYRKFEIGEVEKVTNITENN